MRGLVIGIALAAAGVCAYLLLTPSSEDPRLSVALPSKSSRGPSETVNPPEGAPSAPARVATGSPTAPARAETFGEYFDQALAMPADAADASQSQRLHDVFKNEAIDSRWSADVESQVGIYLSTTRPYDDVDLLGASCHATMCEIQGVARSVDDSGEAANHFQEQIGLMQKESWWGSDGFSDRIVDTWRGEDGRVYFVGYITRARLKRGH